jgi:DNA (cytosine-5)-methyltransferase 1
MYRQVDLCAGTGAFTLALKDYCDVVFANDYEKNSKTIYDLNFNHKLTLGNLLEIDSYSIPDHDVLTCGFPCQSFSISGKRLGFNDVRSNIFWKLIDIIKLKKPKYVLLENVKNIVTHDSNKTFEIIKKSFLDIGYNFQHLIVDTSKHSGIPHHRERVYMIATIQKLHRIELPVLPKESIDIFLCDSVDEKYYYNEKSKIFTILKKEVTKKNTFYQYRRTFVRENKSDECPTLTANMGTGGHNVPIILEIKGIRKLIPRECFNLQGFPKDYNLPEIADSHLYKLAGNAVTVKIVQSLAKKIFVDVT